MLTTGAMGDAHSMPPHLSVLDFEASERRLDLLLRSPSGLLVATAATGTLQQDASLHVAHQLAGWVLAGCNGASH